MVCGLISVLSTQPWVWQPSLRGVSYMNEFVEDKGSTGHTAEGSRLCLPFDKENRKDTCIQNMSGFLLILS